MILPRNCRSFCLDCWGPKFKSIREISCLSTSSRVVTYTISPIRFVFPLQVV